jgi:hypothetical protein
MKHFVLLLLLSPPVTLAGAQSFLTFRSFSYVEPVAIQDALHNNTEHFDGGETALTHNWAEIGATYNNFGVGAVGRFDYELTFSKDTAEFYYLTNNKKPLPQGREFNLDLEAKHIQSTGVRFSYDYALTPNADINVGVSYLNGVRLTDGSIHGSALVLAQNDYDFQFDVDYFYSKDSLFDRNVGPPDGKGYSIDLSMDWDITQNLGANLQIVDLFGRIYWNNAPYTTAVASSSVKEYDQDGYVVYNPVLSGFEGNRDFTQKLDPQINALVRYHWTYRLAALAQVYSFKAEDFYQLGMRYAFSDNSHVSALYMLETGAISLGYKMKYFDILLTSDSLDTNKAHTFGLTINASTDF